MNPIERNHVRRIGQQGPVLLYAHGFGCHQGMWAGITPAFEAGHQQMLMGYTGSGPATALRQQALQPPGRPCAGPDRREACRGASPWSPSAPHR